MIQIPMTSTSSDQRAERLKLATAALRSPMVSLQRVSGICRESVTPNHYPHHSPASS